MKFLRFRQFVSWDFCTWVKPGEVLGHQNVEVVWEEGTPHLLVHGVSGVLAKRIDLSEDGSYELRNDRVGTYVVYEGPCIYPIKDFVLETLGLKDQVHVSTDTLMTAEAAAAHFKVWPSHGGKKGVSVAQNCPYEVFVDRLTTEFLGFHSDMCYFDMLSKRLPVSEWIASSWRVVPGSESIGRGKFDLDKLLLEKEGRGRYWIRLLKDKEGRYCVDQHEPQLEFAMQRFGGPVAVLGDCLAAEQWEYLACMDAVKRSPRQAAEFTLEHYYVAVVQRTGKKPLFRMRVQCANDEVPENWYHIPEGGPWDRKWHQYYANYKVGLAPNEFQESLPRELYGVHRGKYADWLALLAPQRVQVANLHRTFKEGILRRGEIVYGREGGNLIPIGKSDTLLPLDVKSLMGGLSDFPVVQGSMVVVAVADEARFGRGFCRRPVLGDGPHEPLDIFQGVWVEIPAGRTEATLAIAIAGVVSRRMDGRNIWSVPFQGVFICRIQREGAKAKAVEVSLSSELTLAYEVHHEPAVIING